MLVLLRERGVHADRKGMGAMNFGQVVPIGIDGVGVIPGEVAGVGTKATTVRDVVPQRNCRELPALAVLEKDAHGETGRKRRIVKGG